MYDEFDEYLEAGEPSRRERAYGWATAIGDLHRHDVGINVGITPPDVGINVGINDVIKQSGVLTATEENCVKAILRNNRITAKELANDIGVTLRQAERLIASLKQKTNLRREGARRNGRWIFGE